RSRRDLLISRQQLDGCYVVEGGALLEGRLAGGEALQKLVGEIPIRELRIWSRRLRGGRRRQDSFADHALGPRWAVGEALLHRAEQRVVRGISVRNLIAGLHNQTEAKQRSSRYSASAPVATAGDLDQVGPVGAVGVEALSGERCPGERAERRWR